MAVIKKQIRLRNKWFKLIVKKSKKLKFSIKKVIIS
jgi:hypothetical protein